MRHSDVFRGLILPRLGPKIENWENISEDDEGVKDTFEDCRDTCQNKSGCMQYVFREADQTCKTANDIRLGRHKDGQNGMKVTSGWVMDRVDVFVETMDANCLFDQAGWKLPN